MVSSSSDFTRTASQRSSGVGRRSDDEGADGREDREAVDLWAALESLPTYDRARATILSEKVLDRSEGEQFAAAEVVDVKDVDVAQYLTTDVFKLNDPTEDNEIFLRKLQTRMERAGVEQPTVEVRYKNLNVVGKIHLGSRALPTLTNSTLNFFEGILTSLGIMRSNKRELAILDDMYGVLKPGRMTLLLGPPSSGKSTLLTVLSGMQDENLKVEGEIQYNGHNLIEFQPRKTSLYVSQDDNHIPELTVRETMDYSARFQGVGQRYELLAEVLRKEKEQHILPDPDVDFYMKATAMEDVSHEAVTEYTMRFLGLDACADTAVGDQMTRGISGGQKKRLTTGEMIVGPSKVLFMDEISTGLDSTTAYQVVKCIGQNAHILKSTVLISLLQPPPETYDLFDDLILISGGCVVYHGPLEHVEEFFISCGFQCPARKHVADFLQEVTSFKNQEQYWMQKNEPYHFVPVQHFADAFKNFHVGQELQEQLGVTFDKSQGHQAALQHRKYALPEWDLFKLVFKKEILHVKRNYPLYIFIFGQLFFISFVASTLFFRTLRHHRNLIDASEFSGAMFFYLNTIAMMGYNEIVFMTLRKKMFHKFRKMYYFPPWTWALSMFITQIPVAFLGGALITFPTYYIVGFAPAAPRFFKSWLVMSLTSLMSSGLFRMLGSFCPSSVVAGPVGGLILMMVFTLSGFIIPRPHMKWWLKWAYWVFPLSYAENALLVNEFLAHQWKKYSPGSTRSLGHQYLHSLGLYDRGFWFWLGCGALIAFAFGYYVVCAVGLTFIPASGKSKAVVSKQLLDERNRDKTGEGVLSEVSRAASLTRSASLASRAAILPRSASLASRAASLPRSASLALGSPSMRASAGGKSMRSGSLASGRTEPTEHEHDELRSFSGASHQSLDKIESSGPTRGMVMPFQPLSIAFRDINYFVDMPKDPKVQSGIQDNRLQLLSGITGAFRPGILTALVGVTGAGKSTLMDVLSGRKTTGMIEGDIFINGYPKNQETFARISGYCEQNDIHTAQVTVKESLLFSAWLRLPADVPSDMKKDFAMEVMELVELTSLSHALVGVPGESGLSTEQRKRLTIAVELVANPSIVFMDEPTSGLDARAAATVMRAVRNTVDTGRTVVCTIHQPSIDIFESFDELLLLKRGGKTVYAGPLGRDSRHLIEYFEKVEGVPKIRNGQNPAAWMLQITAPGMESKLGVDFAELYRHSSVFEQVKDVLKENSVPAPNTEDISFQTKYAQNRWVQFKCCLWKQHWSYWRNPGYNLGRIWLAFASGLYFGTAFWSIGHNPKTQADLFSLLGAIFTSQIFYGVLTCVAAVPVVNETRTIFYRERSAGMYDEIPYALSMVALELPYILTTSSTFALITYTMIQLDWTADKFFWYLFFLFCSQYTAIIFGMVMVVISPNQEGAQALLNFFFNMWGLNSGFMLPHNKFPVWWTWWYWLQPPSYHIYGMLASQFGDMHDKFVITNDGKRVDIPGLLIQRYGLRHSKLLLIGSISALFPIVLTAIFIFAIKFINYQKR